MDSCWATGGRGTRELLESFPRASGDDGLDGAALCHDLFGVCASAAGRHPPPRTARARDGVRQRRRRPPHRRLKPNTRKRQTNPCGDACRLALAHRCGSEGADGEELVELPEPEPPRPASTDPATTECAVCLDGNAEYAVVPCGHRCLCASCIKAVSECPVCRGAMTAVLRVFV